jgi:hypothetical protein
MVEFVVPVFVNEPAPLMTPLSVDALEITICPAFICVGPV